MGNKKPAYYQDISKCVDDLIDHLGKEVILAIPLAMGKPNHLVNELYRRAKNDPSFQFTLITAVTLEKPTASNDLERRLLEPLVERIWGGFPDFEYILDLRKNNVPSNFTLIEFYNKTAGFTNCKHAKQNYLGSNYTHAIRDARIQRCNAMAQLIAKKEENGEIVFSMGSNPDTNLDALPIFKADQAAGKKRAIIGQVNNNMPFMNGGAKVSEDSYDYIIEGPDFDFKLFGAPKESVNTTDWMIGLHASSLVKDDGTLQVGIGSLGDAIVAGLQMRHTENAAYKKVIKESGIADKYGDLVENIGGTDVFDKGLIGSTEMFVDSLIELFEAGILRRKVYENYDLQTLLNDGAITETVTPEMFRLLIEKEVIGPLVTQKMFDFLVEFGILKDGLTYADYIIKDGETDYSGDLREENNITAIIDNCLGSQLKKAVSIYACFFIGPERFYEKLRNLSEEDRNLIDMRGVAYVNQLFGDDMPLRAAQRKNGRFINAALMAMMSGATVADGLAGNKIISGPGGQYNFIAMAHELPGGRAITMVRSTRGTGSNAVSNIVWDYAHTTIPRHLRDIVVTEYGIADMRGQKDKDVMAQLICIADSRFQDQLLETAKNAGSIPPEYEIPPEFRNNTPERLETLLEPYKNDGHFPMFPFGTDLTEEEVSLGQSLKAFKDVAAESKLKVAGKIAKLFFAPVPENAQRYVERMQLDKPASFKEKMLQKVVILALQENGVI